MPEFQNRENQANMKSTNREAAGNAGKRYFSAVVEVKTQFAGCARKNICRTFDRMELGGQDR